IFGSRVAAAGAVEARDRSVRAALERLAEDVLLTFEGIGAPLQHGPIVPEPRLYGKTAEAGQRTGLRTGNGMPSWPPLSRFWSCVLVRMGTPGPASLLAAALTAR